MLQLLKLLTLINYIHIKFFWDWKHTKAKHLSHLKIGRFTGFFYVHNVVQPLPLSNSSVFPSHIFLPFKLLFLGLTQCGHGIYTFFNTLVDFHRTVLCRSFPCNETLTLYCWFFSQHLWKLMVEESDLLGQLKVIA